MKYNLLPVFALFTNFHKRVVDVQLFRTYIVAVLSSENSVTYCDCTVPFTCTPTPTMYDMYMIQCIQAYIQASVQVHVAVYRKSSVWYNVTRNCNR